MLTAGALNYIFRDYRPICKPLSCSKILEKLAHKKLMRVMRSHGQLHCGLRDIMNVVQYRKSRHLAAEAGKYSNPCESPAHPW